MKTGYCKYKILLNNSDISVSHKTSDISDKELKEIDNIVSKLIEQNNNYLLIEDKRISYNFFKLKTNKQIFTEITNFEYKLEISVIFINEINLFKLLNANFKYSDDCVNIIEKKITQSEINYFFGNVYEDLFKSLFQCILNNYDSDKKIYVKAHPKYALFWMRLIGFLLPEGYNDITYSCSNNGYINYIFETDYNEEYDGYYFDFTLLDYPIDIIPKRYTYTIIDRLRESIESAKRYKMSVNLMIRNHKLDLSTSVDVINLLEGRIERFTKIESLARTIKALDGIDYDPNYIAPMIFTNINKYEKNLYSLGVYSFLYKHLNISRDTIIEFFFNNLSDFDIRCDCNHIDFVNQIEEKCPFDIVDYLYYLKNKGIYQEYLNDSLKDFNKAYFLLELICRDIKLNNKSIVPNDDLLAYISYSIKIKSFNYLDNILERIKKLNIKASSRLMAIKMDKLDKSSSNFVEDLGFKYAIELFERIEPYDALKFYKKAYNSVLDRRVFLKGFNEREEINPDYYNNLLSYIDKDIDMKEFVDRKNSQEIYKIESVNKEELDSIYKEYYLNKYKNDNGVFLSKVLMYLDSIPENDRLSEAIGVFNDYYRSLDLNYKDVFDSIRRINDYIYKNASLLVANDAKYYKVLNEIKEILIKRKTVPNPYFEFIELGLDIKGAYYNKRYNKIIELSSKPQFIEFNDEMFRLFIAYYLRYLLVGFMNSIDPSKIDSNNLIFITGYHNLCDSLCDKLGFANQVINAFNEIEYQQSQVFYFMIMACNTNNIKYKNILLKIFSEIDKKILKQYLIDFSKTLKNINWLSDNMKKRCNDFIIGYINESFSFWDKTKLKLACK